MSYEGHDPDLRSEERGGVLWRQPRCRCGWAGSWTPDRDTSHDQFMAHIREALGLPAPPPPERCDECHGSGGRLCGDCDGRGKVACGVCMGDPGEGIMSCTACQGRGTEECRDCDGYGAERCGTCGKRGPGRPDPDFGLPVPVGGSAPGCLALLGAVILVAACVAIALAVWQVAFG